MTSPITRITMIKVSSDDHIPLALEGFSAFTKNQKKDGKPYILSMEAGPANGTVKAQGYNLVTKNVFANQEDMTFFEQKCEGHIAFRNFMKENALLEGLMTVWFQAGVSWTA